MKKLLIVDGNSILNRAFYGVRPLTNSRGLHTNALFGMLSMLNKQLSEVKPDLAAIAFDLPAPTFRHEKYSEYKAGRKKMPEELAMQLPYAKKLSDLLGFHVLEKEGYEADDILGTVSKMANDAGIECFILTGDRDSLQLIGNGTTVLLMTNSDTVHYDRAKFFETYGVEPEDFVDVKALMGDSSDNIPGVPGIGEKTALKLIAAYHTIDKIYENPDNVGLGRAACQKMKDGKESAYLSKFLATIVRDAPIDITPGQLEIKGGRESELYELLVELEFTNQIKRMGLTPSKARPRLEESAAPETEEVPSEIQNKEKIADDTPMVSAKEKNDTPVLAVPEKPEIALDEPIAGWNEKICAAEKILEFPDEPCDLSLNDEKPSISTFVGKPVSMLYLENELWLCDGHAVYHYIFDNFGALAKAVSDSGIAPILYDCKTQIKEFMRLGLDLPCSGDVMLCAYALNPSRSGYQLHDLLDIYSGAVIAQTPAAECYGIFRLFRVLYSRLGESGLQIAQKIELPLAYVLADMEIRGFALDTVALKEFGVHLLETENDCITRIQMLAGREFNVNSPKQLGQVLFEDLKLPAGKKTKTGYSTNAEVLEKIKDAHPIVSEVLEYREIAKLRSTYADGLLAAADASGRVHTSFNQTIAVTGRLSSTEPNLQNIPVRSQLGREFRRFFVASSPTRVLIDADYSQIELRILAHVANDKTMISAFESGEDVHTVTASNVFGVPLDMVTSELRKRAKAVNFGIVYGMSGFSLAGDLGITRKEASEYIENYFDKYKGIDSYLKNVISETRKRGYTQTVFGRVRYIPELTAQKAMIRQLGERLTMNSPIQGSSADIIKLAMIRVSAALKAEALDAHLILQVHDELIIESSASCAARASEILQREMENVCSLLVPLTVELSQGSSWYECK